MVEINHREHFIRAKILYYGPAAGGKTTNLQTLHRRALREKRLDLVSVNTAQDRTILFDLLPLTTPAFRSYELRFQIVAVPGQKLYAATRKMLLKNADAVVFVANSASDRWTENLQSMKEMTEYLLEHGVDPSALPVIFQYNKRDLPVTTDVELMERGLNARGSDSFPAIAIQEKGVLESFAAALRRTMTELSTRYNIGESLADPRSAVEWTERTMRETFGVTGVAEKRKELKELEPRPPSQGPAPSPTVVRVKTPSQPRTLLSSPPPRPAPPASPPAAAQPTTPRVAKTAPSAAAEFHDPVAAQSLIESYVEAASGLGDHISQLRLEKDQVLQWLEELTAAADLARNLMMQKALPPEEALRSLVRRMARSLGTAMASLALRRPDGKLEPVILYGLEVDPIPSQAIRALLLSAGQTTVQKRGEAGPLETAIERAGEECVAAIALPLGTPSSPVGLLCFFLPQEASIPTTSLMEYLERAALQIGTTMEVASDVLASDRIERSLKEAFVGRVARRAVRWLDEPLARIESAAARLHTHTDAPSWLAEELLQIENNILKLTSMRQSVVGLGVGSLPNKAPTSLAELLAELEAELAEPLAQSGIRLQVEAKTELAPVFAEPFLLWGVLSHMVEDARRSLAGIPSGGVIQVLAHTTDKGVRVAVFDNRAALAPKSSPSQYLAWPLDRRLRETESGIVQTVLDHIQARYVAETREGVGTVRTLLLRPA